MAKEKPVTKRFPDEFRLITGWKQTIGVTWFEHAVIYVSERTVDAFVLWREHFREHFNLIEHKKDPSQMVTTRTWEGSFFARYNLKQDLNILYHKFFNCSRPYYGILS